MSDAAGAAANTAQLNNEAGNAGATGSTDTQNQQTTANQVTQTKPDNQTAQANQNVATDSQQTKQGGNTSDDANKGEQDDSKGDDKAAGAPEKYEDFKLPEGLGTVDPEAQTEFQALAKEANLSQEQAQKMVDLYTKRVGSLQDQLRQGLETQMETWKNQTLTDPLFAGAEAEKNFDTARGALTRFGSPDLQKLLNETGLGNHPEVVKFMYNVGAKIQNDSFVDSNSMAGQVDALDAMYPSMKNVK